jgi:hypothetical protein
MGAGGGCPDDDRGADQRGDRVQPLLEHDGDLADEDVAEDAAADARDRAEDDGGCGGEAVVECFARTSDAEDRESGCVQHVDRPSDPDEERVGKEGDETGAAGDGNVPARLRTSSSIWSLLGVHQRGRQPFRPEHAIAGRA